MENFEKIMDYVSSFKGHKESTVRVSLKNEDRLCKPNKVYTSSALDCDCAGDCFCDCLCTGDFCD